MLPAAPKFCKRACLAILAPHKAYPLFQVSFATARGAEPLASWHGNHHEPDREPFGKQLDRRLILL
jgi:hypothetical protein